jgi:release factor H-coupled RctB family protein
MGTLFDSASLPGHARLIASDEVWIEGDAVAQFARVAAMPGCVRAAAMPDLHPGRGIPVGAAFAFAGAVHPELIGGDAGCGARVVATSLRAGGTDALERRVRAALDEDPLDRADSGALLEAVWTRGVRGFAELDGVPEPLARLAELDGTGADDELPPSGDLTPYHGLGGGFLGTVGGGNHFVEIARVGEVRDEAQAAALGLEHDRLVVVAHSGSRGLGGLLADRFGAGALDGARRDQYLGELAGACRVARANRFVLAYRLLRALAAARASKLTGGFDVIHNYVRAELVDGAAAWVHRKGAAPAAAGQPTIVLSSRGTPSWILAGAGAAHALSSVAHGAGRRMGRSEARAKLKARYRRVELQRTELGGRVLCDDPELLYEEHPDAYKPIEPILDAIVGGGLGQPIAALCPVVTVKR